MEVNDPQGGAICDPRGRIYVKFHITILHPKYRRFGSCGFKDLHVFPIISLWKLLTPQGVACTDHRGMFGRTYKEDYEDYYT